MTSVQSGHWLNAIVTTLSLLIPRKEASAKLTAASLCAVAPFFAPTICRFSGLRESIDVETKPLVPTPEVVPEVNAISLMIVDGGETFPSETLNQRNIHIVLVKARGDRIRSQPWSSSVGGENSTSGRTVSDASSPLVIEEIIERSPAQESR